MTREGTTSGRADLPVSLRTVLDRVRRALDERPEVADALVWRGYLLLVLLTTATYLVPTVIWYTHPPGSRGALVIAGASALTGVAGALVLRRRRVRPVLTVLLMTGLALANLLVTGAPGAGVVGTALAVHALAAAWPPLRTWPAVAFSLLTLCPATVAFLSLDVWDVVMGLGSWRGGAPDFPPRGLPPEQWQGLGRALAAGIDSRVLEATFTALLLLIAVATGLSVRGRRQRDVAARVQADALEREHRQDLLLARTTERTTIAREVHDVVAHSISVMVALADGATAVAPRSPEQAREAMLEVSATGRSALADMKRVLAALHETAPDPREEVADLLAMVDRFRAAGLPVTATGLDAALPGPLALAVRRIVGEALTNVLRHAPGAEQVHVAVVRAGGLVAIEVLDSGARAGEPAETSPGTGRGLVGVRERAAALGGTCEAGPRRGGGWRVAVALPVEERHEEAR